MLQARNMATGGAGLATVGYIWGMAEEGEQKLSTTMADQKIEIGHRMRSGDTCEGGKKRVIMIARAMRSGYITRKHEDA